MEPWETPIHSNDWSLWVRPAQPPSPAWGGFQRSVGGVQLSGAPVCCLGRTPSFVLLVPLPLVLGAKAGSWLILPDFWGGCWRGSLGVHVSPSPLRLVPCQGPGIALKGGEVSSCNGHTEVYCDYDYYLVFSKADQASSLLASIQFVQSDCRLRRAQAGKGSSFIY